MDSVYSSTGVISKGIECYVFTESHFGIPGDCYSVVLNPLFPASVARALAASGQTILVYGSVSHGPSFCMEGSGSLTIFAYQEVQNLSFADTAKTLKKNIATMKPMTKVIADAAGDGLARAEKTFAMMEAGSLRPNDCGWAKFLASIDLGVLLYSAELKAVGYTHRVTECDRLICLFSPRCRLVTSYFDCPDDMICIEEPTVWAVVDVSRRVVVNRGKGSVPATLLAAASKGEWGPVSFKSSCGCSGSHGEAERAAQGACVYEPIPGMVKCAVVEEAVCKGLKGNWFAGAKCP